MAYKQLKFDDKIKPKNINQVIAYTLARNSEGRRVNKTFNPDTGRIIGGTTQWNMSTRSYQDTYLLCKYYFPKTSREDIRKIMYRLKEKRILSAGFCNICKRTVYQPMNFSDTYIVLLAKINEALK